MPFVEVKQSGPDIPDGVYPVILASIDGDRENANMPRHVVPENGPNAGKDLYFWDWKFAINVPGGHPLDGTEIEYSTSTNSGSKSNMYKLLTALLNGVAPAVGTNFEKEDLVGRMALATIQRDQAGYCRIVNLGAVPAGYGVAAAPQVAPAPVAAQPPAQPAQAATMPIREIIPPQPPAPPVAPPPDPGQFVGSVPQAPLRDQVARDDLPF